MPFTTLHFNAWAGAQLSVCFLKASQVVITYSQVKNHYVNMWLEGEHRLVNGDYSWRLLLKEVIKEKNENMEIFLFAFVILYLSFFPNEHILKFKTKPEKYWTVWLLWSPTFVNNQVCTRFVALGKSLNIAESQCSTCRIGEITVPTYILVRVKWGVGGLHKSL